MAVVTSIEKDDREIRALHPTRLPCKYMVSNHAGQRILQLNTYGSDTRQNPGKQSQTLQFDENAASDLFNLLKREYGFD
ncbi:hypothetical protein [Citreimonas sp.]|uniref:hypothetical protein n=1 Tax=Citreimonas sp. TaxID=3036715 RepID=UPI00405A37F3